MSQLSHRHSALELARVPWLENHETAAAHTLAVALNGSHHKLRKVHVADEASALVNLQQCFAFCVPAGQIHAAGKRDCIRTRAGKRLGQAKSAVAQFDPAQVAITLRLGSEVADGHLRQASRKAA